MHIIDVLPLSRGIFRESLSYWSAAEALPGSLVVVPVRNKSVRGIVLRCQSAQKMKTEIRRADYGLKKLESIEAEKFFLPETVAAAIRAAEYFATTPGAVLESITPRFLLETPIPFLSSLRPRNNRSALPSEKKAIGAPDEERFSRYRSMIRESFARGESVLFLSPRAEEAQEAYESLSRGIEQYSFLLNGKISKKEILKRFEEGARERHPVLLCGTSFALSLPRSDIGTIILERENSRWYKMAQRPCLDFRVYAEMLAEELGATLLFGGFLLGTERIVAGKKGEVEISQGKISYAEKRFLAVLGAEGGEERKNEAFETLGTEAGNIITCAQEENGRTLLLSARKGLATTVVCGDCQALVICEHCRANITLAGGENGKPNFFFCRRCGEKRSAKEYCKHCGSWKLRGLGIGSELVEKEASKKFPDAVVLRLDGDSAKTPKKIKEIIQKFENSRAGILVATEPFLPFLAKGIHSSVIVSLDSLLAIPDFRMNEKVCAIILEVSHKTTRSLVVQTRRRESDIFSLAVAGNTSLFYAQETDLRKTLQYPPFGTLIKITRGGKAEMVLGEVRELSKTLSEYDPTLFSIGSKTSGKLTVHVIISLPDKKWVDGKLLAILRTLSPKFRVEVDPDSLFALPNSKEYL